MLGLTVNHSLLIVALLLIIIDFYFTSDILTHIAYIVFCIVIFRLLELPLLYNILIALCCWFIIVALHYCFFKKFLSVLANKIIAPDKYQAGIDHLIGQKGICKIIQGVKMIEANGDLWNYESTDKIEDGNSVIITGCRDGLIVVSLLKEAK